VNIFTGISEYDLLGFFDRATNRDGIQFFKDNPGRGIWLAGALARFPCILSKCDLQSYTRAEQAKVKLHGCINCDNGNVCEDQYIFMDRISEFCCRIFLHGTHEVSGLIALALVRIK